MDRSVIEDLKRIKDEFEIVIESLELSSDPEFMAGYLKAKLQIAERDFEDWDALQDIADP